MNDDFSLDRRGSGLLLHVTSLPGLHGIGDFGPEAFAFVDFLNEAGQRWWQMFPLGPPGYGGSPYQVLSAFAGNPLLISLEKLRDDGLLSDSDVKPTPKLSKKKTKTDEVERYKTPRFRKAFKAFLQKNAHNERPFQEFCVKHDYWLSDYALYRALKDEHDGISWSRWEPDVRKRNPFAVEKAKERLADPVLFEKFLQFEFFKQLSNLKTYCIEKGVGLIGDVPIFVAHDSADVWSNPEIFWLDAQGEPTVVAGVPPDYFSKTGQLWGNPHYRWAVLGERGYDWWIARFRSSFEHMDAVRLDHFIGFHRYWEVAANAKTAEHGRWVEVPGEDFFTHVFKELPSAQFIAEDLGIVTPEVRILRDKFNLPGMRVMQFGFDGSEEAKIHLPHSYTPRCVAYTGTHDNDTTLGWFNKEAARANVLAYTNGKGKDVNWDLMRAAWMSAANTVVAPVQDVLGLGSEARMNKPGTVGENWEWRLLPGQLSRRIAERLYKLTLPYDRLNPKSKK